MLWCLWRGIGTDGGGQGDTWAEMTPKGGWGGTGGGRRNRALSICQKGQGIRFPTHAPLSTQTEHGTEGAGAALCPRRGGEGGRGSGSGGGGGSMSLVSFSLFAFPMV